jgi:FkbM family methyltransferase
MQANPIKHLANQMLSGFGLSLVNKVVHEQATEKASSFELLIKSRKLEDVPFITLLGHLNQAGRQAIYPYLLLSKSQLAQDLFVLSRSTESGFPRFFVEFGATDGIKLSNTYLLEKHLGWKGILAEPAKVWHSELKRNRSCQIDCHCVSERSGMMVDFLEASSDPNDAQASPELSSIASFAESGDSHSQRRLRNSKTYKVATISLNDLLEKHSAPKEMGYLSIDTEGSEIPILESFDFQKYSFRTITVEHNYIEAKRSAIQDLLEKNGYKRVLEEVSLWDDWYILENP